MRMWYFKHLIKAAEEKKLIDDIDHQEANTDVHSNKFMHELIENIKIEGLED